MAGGVVPISKSQFALAMKNVVCLPCALTRTLAARLLENVSYHFLSFLVPSAQVAPVATDLADESCARQLRMMMDRKLGDIATDTTYLSAHWHANEVTTIVFNASSGCDAYAHLRLAYLLKLVILFFQSNEAGLLWPGHTC